MQRELLEMRVYNLLKHVDELNSRALLLKDSYTQFANQTAELDTEISTMLERLETLTTNVLQHQHQISANKNVSTH